MSRVYQLNAQTIGRFLRRVESLVCYRCGVELVANQWVYSKASRGDTTILSERRHSACQHGYGQPKIYHLECAKEVKLDT